MQQPSQQTFFTGLKSEQHIIEENIPHITQNFTLTLPLFGSKRVHSLLFQDIIHLKAISSSPQVLPSNTESSPYIVIL